MRTDDKPAHPDAPAVATPKSSPAPARHLAVVTCMDARIDVFGSLGIALGDAHILRNAGGLVTDDVIRSLMISQRLLGTTDIAVIQHTDCGLSNLDEAKVRAEIRSETGVDPPFPIGSFDDLEASVRAGVETLRQSPLLIRRNHIRGYVYDVASGILRAVPEREAPSRPSPGMAV